MALPLSHTLSRNASRDMIVAGKYANVRIHGITGNVRARPPGRLSTLRISHSESAVCGAFVWVRRARNGLEWRFPARADEPGAAVGDP